MKKTALVFALILSTNLFLGQNIPKEYFDLIKKAETFYKDKDFRNSAEKYSEAFKALGWTGIDYDRYNAACSWAMAKVPDSAFFQLERIATQMNFLEYDHIKSDQDLKSLYTDKRWKALLEIVRKNKEKAEANYDRLLIEMLDSVLMEDQMYRQQIDGIEKKYGWQSKEMKDHLAIITEKDSINLIKVKSILDKYGWLGPDVVGEKGNSTLFLVIQHSDRSTQKKYLPMLREAVKKGKAQNNSLAYLEDRVALGQGKRQIYGSQIGRDPETQIYYVLPLEDPDNVDKRRAEIGLELLAEYVSRSQIKWDVEQYKKDLPKLEKKSGILSPISSDCEKAISIAINGNTVYGPTLPTEGYGNKQEITIDNKLLFEKEHNSAWYILNIEQDGEMVFEIVPTNQKDDYDFLVYKYGENDFCNQFFKNTILPLKSNLSRVDGSIKGITGLMANVKNSSVGKGIGNAYSKSISVKKGEKYMLILDNVYPNGDGHTIYFNFLKEVEIKGKIVNSNNLPIEAEISLSDNFGNTIKKIKSNTSGEYDFKTSVKENENYNLITSSERTFIKNTKLNTNALKNSSTFNNEKIVLPILKVGAKYNFGNINFYGNLPDLLPCSYPSADALCQLMLKNKKLVIQIEGHVNKGVIKSKEDELFNQQLSEQRAKTLFNYLIKKGVSKDCLSIVGLSATQMIFPKPKTEMEQEANRRVEIKITSME